MSDLGLAIDYSSVLEATKATKNLEDSWARMVMAIIAEERRLEAMAKATDTQIEDGFRRMTKAVEDEAQKHYTTLVNKRMAFQRAMDRQRSKEESDAMASLRRQADEENRTFDEAVRQRQRLADSVTALENRLDPTVKAMREEQNAIDMVNQAMKSGAIEMERGKKLLADLENGAMHGAQAWNQFGVKSLMSGKNLGYFGMVTQQAGYQLQDFFVQVQAGTSPLVALGQQGSQMAGIFGPGGAIIGALLAVGTAIAGVAFKSIFAAKELDKLTQEAKKSFEEMAKSSELISKGVSESLSNAFKVARKDLQEFLDTWNKLEAKALGKQLVDIREGLKSAVQGSSGPSVFDSNWNATAVLEAANDSRELSKVFDNLTATTMPELVKQFVETNQQIQNSKIGSQELRDLAQEQLFERAKELGILDQVLEKQKDTEKVVTDTKTQNLAYVDALIDKYAAQQQSYEDRVAVAYQTYAASRQASIDAERAKWESYADAQLKKNSAISSDKEEEAKKEKERLQKASEYYANSRKDGEALARVDLASALAGATTNAEGLATAMFNTLGYAQAIKALFGFGGSTTYGEVFQGPPVPGGFIAERERLRGLRPNQMEDPDLDGLPGESTGGKKSGGGSKKTAVDRIKELEAQYQQKLRIASVTGDQLKYEEAYNAVIKATGEDTAKYSSDFLEAKAQELAAVQKQIDLENERQDLYKSVSGSLTDMMMSLADGTTTVKDAFTDMARSIIKELYQVLVVKQAVNAVMGFIGVGNMPTASAPVSNTVSVNDAVISPKGQIISTSPEDFLIATKKPGDLAASMSGSSNGTSSGSIVVNQSFNISGSDQATVQQALAKALPVIVDATKSAIVDARRRGSSDLRGAF